jgi:preprotein translocase subunit SecE
LLQVRVLPDPPFFYRAERFMGDWIERLQDGIRRLTEFFQEAWQELKKVHWPSRKETYAATLVVIIVVVLVSVYLALIDLGLTKAIQAIVE